MTKSSLLYAAMILAILSAIISIGSSFFYLIYSGLTIGDVPNFLVILTMLEALLGAGGFALVKGMQTDTKSVYSLTGCTILLTIGFIHFFAGWFYLFIFGVPSTILAIVSLAFIIAEKDKF